MPSEIRWFGDDSYRIRFFPNESTGWQAALNWEVGTKLGTVDGIALGWTGLLAIVVKLHGQIFVGLIFSLVETPLLHSCLLRAQLRRGGFSLRELYPTVWECCFAMVKPFDP